MTRFTWLAAILVLCASVRGDDEPLAKYPDLAAIERDHDKAVAQVEGDADKQLAAIHAKRLEAYKKNLASIRTSGDTDKIVLVGTRLKEYELEADKEKPVTGQKVKILSAFYGVNQSWFDVTDALQAKIGKTNKFVGEVTDKDWGDPAPDYRPGNTLIVRYSVRGRIANKAVYAGQQITIP